MQSESRYGQLVTDPGNLVFDGVAGRATIMSTAARWQYTTSASRYMQLGPSGRRGEYTTAPSRRS
jgi:hypothetical protein